VGALLDGGAQRGLAPLGEGADGGDEDVVPLDEVQDRLRPLDVGDRVVEAAELLGQGAQPGRGTAGEDGSVAAGEERAGGEVTGVAGGPEEDDAGRPDVTLLTGS
jgi:hypothetical protein